MYRVGDEVRIDHIGLQGGTYTGLVAPIDVRALEDEVARFALAQQLLDGIAGTDGITISEECHRLSIKELLYGMQKVRMSMSNDYGYTMTSSVSGSSIYLNAPVQLSGMAVVFGSGANMYTNANYGGQGPRLESHMADVIKSKDLLQQFDVDSNDFARLVKVITRYGGNVNQLKKEMRATKLITDAKFLNDKEFEELIDKNYVTITSKKHPERTYRLSEQSYEQIQVFEEGKELCRLCALPESYDDITKDQFTDIDRFINRVMAVKNDENYVIDHSNIYMSDLNIRALSRKDLKRKGNFLLPKLQKIVAKMTN